MIFQRIPLAAKLNIAIALPIAPAFLISGAAYIGITQVSKDARLAMGVGAHIAGRERVLSTIVERIGRLMSEPVAKRLDPEIKRLGQLADTIAESVNQHDANISDQVSSEMAGLDELPTAKATR